MKNLEIITSLLLFKSVFSVFIFIELNLSNINDNPIFHEHPLVLFRARIFLDVSAILNHNITMLFVYIHHSIWMLA